jgi:hypothetical protein
MDPIRFQSFKLCAHYTDLHECLIRTWITTGISTSWLTGWWHSTARNIEVFFHFFNFKFWKGNDVTLRILSYIVLLYFSILLLWLTIYFTRAFLKVQVFMLVDCWCATRCFWYSVISSAMCVVLLWYSAAFYYSQPWRHVAVRFVNNVNIMDRSVQ